MNIVYATRATIPFPSAASINSMQMCEALAHLGHDVTLMTGAKPWRPGTLLRNVWDYYGIEQCFRFHRLLELPRTGMLFDRRVVRHAQRQQSLVYCRYIRLLPALMAAQIPTVLEIHSVPAESDLNKLKAACEAPFLQGIVVITQSLKNALLKRLGPAGRNCQVVVAPDAVNPSRFKPASERGVRKRPQAVGYVGSLYPGKGVEVVVPLAERFPEIPFHIFGGTAEAVREWQSRTSEIKNLHWEGFLKPAEVPAQFARFDIALLPNQPVVRMAHGDDIGSYTSPMKLFEYMAAGKAIIASDLPVLTEVVAHRRNALVATHDDIDAWEAALQELLNQPQLQASLGQQARTEAVENYTYLRRFSNIFDDLQLTDQNAADLRKVS